MDYSELSKVYSALSQTTKRLEKTAIIAEFLKIIPDDELERIMLLLRGRVFPAWDKQTLGVSSKLVVKAIAMTVGDSEANVINSWKKIGDLGEVAVNLLKKKKQATLFARTLTTKEVFEDLQKLPKIEGHGSVDKKLKIISSLLSAAEGDEVIFLIRTVLEDMRVGVADGTLRDAIVAANFLLCINEYLTNFNYDATGWTAEVSKENEDAAFELGLDFSNSEDCLPSKGSRIKSALEDHVQSAYDRCNDFVQVARAAKKGISELKNIKLTLGKPIRVMLAQREADIKSALDRVGRPAILEYKYDGFRMQISKDGDKITIFTRRLEPVTTQFPDVVEAVRKYVKAESCLLDSEAVGFDAETGKFTPFQHISQRIRRKYDIEELAKKLPIELNVFDILYLDGEELIDVPLKKRRELLRKSIPEDIPKSIKLSTLLETSDDQEGEKFYKESLAAGNEGIMVKNLEGVYKPGARVGHMVKVKPTLDTMDLVITAAEWGEGKRSGWFTSFTIACYDPADDQFLEIGKVGTGFKELDSEDPDAVTFSKLTELLKPLITEEDGKEVFVKPEVILEIKFEEVQKSPSYSGGFALRFPRVERLRTDRSIEDMTTIDEVEVAFRQQR